MAIGRTAPRTTRVTQQGDMGYGLQVTAPIEAGSNIAAYLLTGLSYIDPECAEPVVYSCDLPLVEACGPAVASWMRAAHQCPLDIHNTRVVSSCVATGTQMSSFPTVGTMSVAAPTVVIAQPVAQPYAQPYAQPAMMPVPVATASYTQAVPMGLAVK